MRDLFVSGDSKKNATLTVREDKQRVFFVNSSESIVTSMDSLLSVLQVGENNRGVAATEMNERSSRSHTIFKITVESRLKQAKKCGEETKEDAMRNADCGHGSAVRVSTLNLVDLAGSESVRRTGATGDRQKEGRKINTSLFTLSQVITSLGQKVTHVPYRDSNLTRILQPSLSGNARMAVICCATPSELEETRSTLQFASSFKLVKTHAQVDEIMDDKSLIRKLQREVKEARRGGTDKEATAQMKVLEEKQALQALVDPLQGQLSAKKPAISLNRSPQLSSGSVKQTNKIDLRCIDDLIQLVAFDREDRLRGESNPDVAAIISAYLEKLFKDSRQIASQRAHVVDESVM